MIWNLPSRWALNQEGGNHYLHATADGVATRLNPLIDANMRFQSDLRLNGGTGSLWYRRSFDRCGYRLDVMSTGLSLYRVIRDESETLITSEATPISSSQWHTLEISGTLGHLQVFADGQKRLDTTDTQPWYAGGIGLETTGGNIQVDFDNLKVWAVVNPEPAWHQANGPYGGFVSSIEIDPTNPQVLYAAGAGGAVLKSTNAGNSWAPLDPIVPFKVGFSNLMLAPDDPQTIYTLADGNSLFKSGDGGEGWKRLAAGDTLKCVAISRQNPAILLTGSYDGQVYLTQDAGDTWDNITANLPTGDIIGNVAVPDGENLWVGNFNLNGGKFYHATISGGNWVAVNVGQAVDHV